MPINPTYFRADSTIAAQDRFDQHPEILKQANENNVVVTLSLGEAYGKI